MKEQERILRFEIANTRGSRHREQKSLARQSGVTRRRMIYLGGQGIRPGRSIYMYQEELQLRAPDIRKAEESGLIIVKYDGRAINLDAAISLINGEEVVPPFTKISNVNDPMPSDRAGADQIRTLQPILRNEQEAPPEPDETPAVDEPVAVEGASVDLSGLELVLHTAVKPVVSDKPEAVVVEVEEEADEFLTVKEAASYLGRSMSWIRRRIKTNEISVEVVGGVQRISEAHLRQYMTE